MLETLNLSRVYDSSSSDIARDLIVPLLSNSVSYYRGVGYFSSGWLRVAAKGLIQLVENGGIGQIVVSPVLHKSDLEAIALGEEGKLNETLKSILQANIDNLEKSLETNTLGALAWMVSDNLLHFRFAVPRPEYCQGNYHDKVAVFKDASGKFVAIHGSFNDSIQGTLNGEAFSVFRSWIDAESDYVTAHKNRLFDLWEDRNLQFKIFDVPDAIRKRLVSLRLTNRPYVLDSSQPGNRKISNNIKCVNNNSSPPEPSKAKLKSPYHLRDFQEEAIASWISNGYKGILEMATGTGKTITALCTALKLLESKGRVAVIISVPFVHLVDQWKRVCDSFGFESVSCCSSVSNWKVTLTSSISDYLAGSRKYLIILSVHKTTTSRSMIKALNRIPSEELLFIGDEVHGLGAKTLVKSLPENASMRMGLSATPERWFDEKGSIELKKYFGDVCFSFDMKKAIENGYLTRYRYEPILVELNEDELAAYESMTKQIAFLALQREKIEEDDKLKLLLMKRALILSRAERKKSSLTKLVNCLIRKNGLENISHLLVYCAPGTHTEVLRHLSSLGLRCHEFVHYLDMSSRERILNYFGEGKIQVLVAIKCLDEGVDIPDTRSAVFLASTTNPREFIQRRGRILRLSEGKKIANIFDFVVVPAFSESTVEMNVAISILRHEMPRFCEFSSLATNQFSARSKIIDVLDKYGVLHLLEIEPWKIHNENVGRNFANE